MDIDTDEFDSMPNDVYFDVTECLYSIFLYPTIFKIENVAVAVLAPAVNHSGGAIRIFNYMNSDAEQVYAANNAKLNAGFIRFKQLIKQNRNGRLVWEGKPNGFNKKIRSQFESPWLN